VAVDPASLAGQAAVYKVVGSGVGMKVVSRIMLLLIGTEPVGPDTAYWLQLNVTKTDGKQLVATVLVDDPHLSPERAPRTRVHRYIYQEADDQPIEYVNAVRGGAVTTVFGLMPNFFPSFSEADLAKELFPARGRYLGLPIERVAVNTADVTEGGAVPPSPLRLELDPELLIGTSRNSRDTQGGRIWTGEDYPYRRLEKEDYDELIAAGFNYFRVDDKQELIVRNLPVFYLVSRRPRFLEYPEMFYRANCRGTRMFMDEPGVHIVWFVRQWPGYVRTLEHPARIARLLEARVRESYESQYGYGKHCLEHLLRMAPFDLGDLQVPETHYPAWETMEWSAYYQMKAGLPGVVHEGRYVFGNEPQVFNAEFDARIPCEPKSLFLRTYGFLRGAARVFNGDWGTSIYGQSEQELNPLAMTLAYDMGARYVWFWTSDRLHHVPYEEQVALAKLLRDHARGHPREPLARLRRAAQVAIALPDGYALRPHRLWDTETFHLDRRNDDGVTFRHVLSKAVGQIERCIKQEIPFDIVYADDAFQERLEEYERVIFIGEDARVAGRRRGGGSFEVPEPTRTEQERSARPPDLTVHAEPTEGPAPLTVRLSAEVKSHSGPAGLKRREKGGSGWDYWEVMWVVQVDPHEAGLLHSDSGQTIEILFDRPGTYRIEAWTCDDRGIAARKVVTIRAR